MPDALRMMVLSLMVVTACGARRPEIATMPPEARAQWDRCADVVQHGCHEHAGGAASHERECIEEESSRFASLRSDEERASYLRAHGCRL